MKRILTVLVIGFFALLSSNDANAQKLFDKGDALFNAGIGTGNIYGGGLPIQVSAEWFVTDAISVGPYLGFTSWRYRTAGYRWNYTFFDLGGKGSYHFAKHINMNTDKLDLYGSVMLGYTISSYSANAPGNTVYRDAYGDQVKFGIVGGARWFFSENFAVNGEVGYGISPLLVGISLKF
jgi:hypothetical protein